VNALKKSSCTLTIILINTVLVFAQKVKTVDISKPGTEKIEPTITISAPVNAAPHVTPDVRPDFKGGQAALNLFISKNLQYPKMAVESEIQGVLVVELAIAKDGTARFEKFVRQLGYGCEDEAKRLIKKMPKWNPATLNGKPIDFNYTMRLTFKLSD
jgi:protein TonB